MKTFRLLLVFGLLLGAVVQADAQSKAADTLKRAGLLPDPKAKPPTFSKEEGELVQALFRVWQTKAGRASSAPTADQPIYYVVYDGGLQSNIRGVESPSPIAADAALREALTLAGYQPATNEHRPSVAIVRRLIFQDHTTPFPTSNAVVYESGPYTNYSNAPLPKFSYSVSITAYDYEDLTHSKNTLLWETGCSSATVSRDSIAPPRSPAPDVYLAFTRAVAPYLGLRFPGNSPFKNEFGWVAIPPRPRVAEPTAAFPVLSPPPVALSQQTLREMAQADEKLREATTRKEIENNGGRGRVARPDPAAPVEISPALAKRIAAYVAEKNTLQEMLSARTKGLSSGAETDRAAAAFASEQANRISDLTLIGEALRRTIFRMGSPAERTELKNKPLEELLRQFAVQIRTAETTGEKQPIPAKPSPAAPTRESQSNSAPAVTPSRPTVDNNPPVNATTLTGIAVAELTQRGANGPWPAELAPVRYVAFEGGYIESGPGWPKPPEPASVAGSLRLALNGVGYFPATPEAPPSIALIYFWGAMYSSQDFPATTAERMMTNVTSTKLGPGSQPRLPTNYSVLPGTSEREASDATFRGPNFGTGSTGGGGVALGRYFVVVTAYDFADLAKAKATPLWRLKLSASEREGHPMGDTITSLLAEGVRSIGRSSAWAGPINAPVAKYVNSGNPPTMQIGDLPPVDWQFIDDLRDTTCAWLKGKRETSPDDEAFRAEQALHPPLPPLPPAVQTRVAAYQEEKADLQRALAAWVKNQPGDSRTAVKTFNERNAERIAALEQNREKIRGELAQLAASSRGAESRKNLDDLIRQFAGDAAQLAPR